MCLGKHLKNELRKLQSGDLSSFPYLTNINGENISQFVVILKHFITNLSVRFFNVSYSLNKRSVNRFLDYDQMTFLPGAPLGDGSRCGLSQILEIFNICHTTIPSHLTNTFSFHGIGGEWGMFISVALLRRDDIVRRRLEEAESLCKSENNIQELLRIQPTTNLLDVFRAIDKNEYPNIWRFVIRNLTIMPTTVACEQSFSYFKRTAHINMSETTAKNFLFARLGLYEKDFHLYDN